MGLSFLEGVLKASSMILVSEIGDKTFFLAALMAMRHPRRYVSVGSLSALWVMTLLSALLGWSAPSWLPRKWTHLLATLLFFSFGLRSLWDGISMGSESSRAEEEMREVEAQLDESEKKEEKREQHQQQNGHAGPGSFHDSSSSSKEPIPPLMNGTAGAASVTKRTGELVKPANGSAQALEGTSGTSRSKARAGTGATPGTGAGSHSILNPVIVQAFSLVFFGEWGDKSQIATIGLAAEENVWGVALGGCLGHLICNGIAVMGGKHLATRISEQMVAIIGGLLFLGFGIHSFLHGPA